LAKSIKRPNPLLLAENPAFRWAGQFGQPLEVKGKVVV